MTGKGGEEKDIGCIGHGDLACMCVLICHGNVLKNINATALSLPHPRG